MSCADATVPFLRFVEAPGMSSDDVVKTLRQLAQERCADVKLLAALSRRFHSYAEEFFPPQIDELLGHFATLGYTDDYLLNGTLGRLQDLAATASPRRVIRLMRAGSALRWKAEEWFPELLPALRQNLPNFREGIPSALASLHAIRWKDAELQELFLTQGFLVAEESNDIYLARVLEAWSRTCAKDPEVTDRMEQLAEQICAPESNKNTELAHDMRDALNVLATLMRSSPESKLISQLEAHLSSKLRGASYAEAMLTLQWMQRLALRSAELWEACAEVVELGLKEKSFVRDHFADAVHCLASLSVSKDEAALVSKLISSAEAQRAASRQTAEKTLRVLHAASIIQLEDSILESWGSKAARLARQMSLPDRRILRMISDAKPKASAQLAETVAKMPVVPLPPLCTSTESENLKTVQKGSDAVLQAEEGDKKCIKYMGFGDALAGEISPSCRLSVRALEQHGLTVELRS